MQGSYVRYLHYVDYLPLIQGGQLNDQVLDELESGLRERRWSEAWALEKIQGKISDKYDLDYEFTATLPFSFASKYNAGNRIILDYPEWELGKSYTLDTLICKDGIAYICLVDISEKREFTESNWQSIGKQYDIYHVDYPYPVFSLDFQRSKGAIIKGNYDIGDKVWWNNKIYTCLIPSRFLDHEDLIQLPSYKSAPKPNIFPNAKGASAYWKDEGDFYITGELPGISVEGQDENKWSVGDNRNPLVVQSVIDLALFQLHSRVSPQNIPQLRIDRMTATMRWLKDISEETELINLEKSQPAQGSSFRWGGKPRVENGYR